MSWFEVLPEPVRFNRDSPQANGCNFACRLGWTRGFRDPVDSAGESVRGQIGTWSPAPTEANYRVMDGGAGFDGGSGATNRLNFSGADGRYQMARNCSAMILLKPEVLSNNEEAAFSYENNTGPDQGWGITASFSVDPNPNSWHYQVNNGAIVEVTAPANSTTLNLLQVLILVFDPNASQLRGYINGKLVGTVASSTASILNPPLVNFQTVFADNGGTPPIDMECLAAVSWNRALSAPEVSKMSADPYHLWRDDELEEFAFGSFGAARQTFFLAF